MTMMPDSPSPRPSPARERLLATASRIFYTEGIHSVGVDKVIAEAQVTRATFYRHFSGKEDLVRAYLEARDQTYRAMGAQAAQMQIEPGELLMLMVNGVADEVCSPGFRGCPFINAAAEFPDPEHPVRQVVSAHRAWFRDTLESLLAQAGHPNPDQAVRTLVMLRDGAMVAGYLEDAEQARLDLVREAAALAKPAQGNQQISRPARLP
ncbi:TetR/AcrR family transcriptional regulator [Streptomyces sp. NPDC005065]|uniref:TetR/AcrR family transcriptional regulator n=1 Tax=Streptomyces sp. NPDC005065 TaxID=3154461 RepID=UPI0033BFB72A